MAQELMACKYVSTTGWRLAGIANRLMINEGTSLGYQGDKAKALPRDNRVEVEAIYPRPVHPRLVTSKSQHCSRSREAQGLRAGSTSSAGVSVFVNFSVKCLTILHRRYPVAQEQIYRAVAAQ